MSQKPHLCYRIVEVDNKGNYKTLFHGVRGSRILPLNKWLVAEKKIVCDGNSKTSTKYRAGFHVLLNFADCDSYLKKFKNIGNKLIVEVIAKNIRPKKHSPYPVYLADEIKVLG